VCGQRSRGPGPLLPVYRHPVAQATMSAEHGCDRRRWVLLSHFGRRRSKGPARRRAPWRRAAEEVPRAGSVGPASVGGDRCLG
jgi:hypothetical protein